MAAPKTTAAYRQKADMCSASSSRFCPRSLEMAVEPPRPNTSPKATISVKSGAHRETPATSSVLPVCAINQVSVRL